MTGKPLMLLCPGAKRRHAYRSARLRKRVARRQVFSIGEEAVDGAVDDDDGGGVSAAATDGSAAHNAHGPRRAGIPSGAVRQPPMERQRLLQRPTRRPRKIFAYLLRKNTNRTVARRWHYPAINNQHASSSGDSGPRTKTRHPIATSSGSSKPWALL